MASPAAHGQRIPVPDAGGGATAAIAPRVPCPAGARALAVMILAMVMMLAERGGMEAAVVRASGTLRREFVIK